MTLGRLSAALLALAGAGSCAEDEEHPGWEDFQALVWQEPGTGVYIANGDELFEDIDSLRAFYDEWREREQTVGSEKVGRTSQPLAVNRARSSDDRWTSSQALDLTYCVSQPGFGQNYDGVVEAMHSASGTWEGAARVRYVHRSELDGNCLGATEAQVVFRVLRIQGQPYLARSFFPSSSWANRMLVIDTSSFGRIAPFTLSGILRHELGHTLGFRHEHTRPEAGACFENDSWRALTPYDSASVMHYPQCNGTNQGDLMLTARDREGVAALYGAP